MTNLKNDLFKEKILYSTRDKKIIISNQMIKLTNLFKKSMTNIMR